MNTLISKGLQNSASWASKDHGAATIHPIHSHTCPFLPVRLSPRASVYPSSPGMDALTSLSGCGTFRESGVAAWGPARVGSANACLPASGAGRARADGGGGGRLRGGDPGRSSFLCRCAPAPVQMWPPPALACVSRRLEAWRGASPTPLAGDPTFFLLQTPIAPVMPPKPNNGSVLSHINVYSPRPGPSCDIRSPSFSRFVKWPGAQPHLHLSLNQFPPSIKESHLHFRG